MAFIPIEEQLEKEKRNTQKKVEKAINKTIDETRIQDIKLFMESTGETFEKVCDMLEITDEDIVRYRKML